jgi:hypothetical protein
VSNAWFGGSQTRSASSTTASIGFSPSSRAGSVMVGARDLYDTRLRGSHCRDRAALLGRHDRVARAVHDRRRHMQARELVGERVAVAKQGLDGQGWIVDSSHRGEVNEGRAKDESGRRLLGRELGHHRRAKALAVIQEARRRSVGLFDQEPVGGADIAGEPLLARSPRVATVAAVVEQQHRQTRARQCARQRRSQRPVAGVSICTSTATPRSGSPASTSQALSASPSTVRSVNSGAPATTASGPGTCAGTEK